MMQALLLSYGMCAVGCCLIRAVFKLYTPTFKAYKVLGTLCLSRTCEQMHIHTF